MVVTFLGGTWSVSVGTNNVSSMPFGSSLWEGSYPVSTLSCVGGILTGTVTVPFSSSTGVGCGSAPVTVVFS